MFLDAGSLNITAFEGRQQRESADSEDAENVAAVSRRSERLYGLVKPV
jgi:hypothetical protein